MASGKIRALKINFAIGFTRKNRLECIGKAVNDAVPWLNKATSRIFRPTANFENFKIHLYFVCQLACQPAIRLGCARCRAPEISHNKGNGSRFTKILFRRRFTHCAMAIPFISFIPFLVLLYSLSKVRISPKVMIASYGFCLLHHTKTWFARDIISYSDTMFLCFRVYFITL